MKASILSKFALACALISSSSVLAEAIAGDINDNNKAATVSDSQDYDVEIVLLDKSNADHYKQVYGITDDNANKEFAETFGQEYIQVASNGSIHIARKGHRRGSHRSCVAFATSSGLASFYGTESGTKTASGRKFRPTTEDTAANKSWTFGTKVKVTYGGRSVIVTITDDGPHKGKRVLDISSHAAHAIGLVGAGVGTVQMEVLSCG